jgi:rod shape determining protein RodA
MVVGLMPIMGIPLPLLSYGGSNLLMLFASLGIALSLRLRRFVN